MKEEFSQYLRRIGITETFLGRIGTIYEFYDEICPDEITGIFVTDYIAEEGLREYENLWFFSQDYCMEAKRFTAEDDSDITPIQNRIRYYRVRKQDYDFKEAGDESRLHLFFGVPPDVTGDLKASRENCDYLRDIILKYIAPNLKK